MSDPYRVMLKPGKESSVERRHPWLFRGALSQEQPPIPGGATVQVCDSQGRLLGRGGYSASSQIAIKMWSFDPEEEVNRDFLRRRLEQALRLRRGHFTDPEGACRLVNSENDLLPGIVVDRYRSILVIQLLTAAADAWRQDLLELLQALLQPQSIYERSDADVRRLEGLGERNGLLWGAELPQELVIREADLRLVVDIRGGHKTGLYLDQRDNRAAVHAASAGARVLNCFSYTGAFSVAAALGGAIEIVSVDVSAPALAIAQRNMQLNGIAPERSLCVEQSVFDYLRRCRDSAQTFDVIILDPPKFAEKRAQLDKACRGYKDINLLAFKLLRPGGRLFTYSCSGLVSADLFRKIVAGAAADAKREVQILRQLHQSADHPVNLAFPEGEYLKGLELLAP